MESTIDTGVNVSIDYDELDRWLNDQLFLEGPQLSRDAPPLQDAPTIPQSPPQESFLPECDKDKGMVGPEKIIPEELPPRGGQNQGTDPRKQYQAIGWFLTYPQCPLSPQQALDLLQKLPYQIKEYVIAAEEHKDGTPHLHAFIKYHKKVTWRANLWDLEQYHGNYQGAKCWRAVEKYVKKGGNYISNLDLHAASVKKAARTKELLETPILDLIKDGLVGAYQIRPLIQARTAYQTLGHAVQTPNVKGVWLIGKSGIGKSYLVRDLFKGMLYFKAQNKWFDGYQGQEVILLDDYDIHSTKEDPQQSLIQAFGHNLKIWADRYAVTAEQKGTVVNLHHRLFIITSQYDVHRCFKVNGDYELHEAISRRFTVIKYDSRDQYESITNQLIELFNANIAQVPTMGVRQPDGTILYKEGIERDPRLK